MKAMILAAGEGRRMLPLTATLPKPLLPVGNTTLIGYQLQRLRLAGVHEVVINVAYLGQQIQQALGDGSSYGLKIQYSEEPYPLETGGGIWRALPLLGDEPFILLNSDVFTDFPLAQLPVSLHDSWGHFVLVANPSQHPCGDFALTANGLLQAREAGTSFTFSGISLMHPRLIATYPHKREKFGLLEVLTWAINQQKLTGSFYSGLWLDVGTPERLALCRTLVSSGQSFA